MEAEGREESLKLFRFRHCRHLRMHSTETSKQNCYSTMLFSDILFCTQKHTPILCIPYLQISLSSSSGLRASFNSKCEHKTSSHTVHLQSKHAFSCARERRYGLYVPTNGRNWFLLFHVPRPFVLPLGRVQRWFYLQKDKRGKRRGISILKEHHHMKSQTSVLQF